MMVSVGWYKKPRPLVNVTARTSGFPLRPKKVGLEVIMIADRNR